MMKKAVVLLIAFLGSIQYLSAQSKDNSGPRDIVAEPEPETIFTVVEQMPEFLGGEKSFIKYLSKNIVYPTEAQKSGIEGTVYVNFIVTETGDINNVKIVKGLSKECDEEVLRVVRKMPRWKPGKQNHKSVAVRLTYPFSFKLNDNVVKERPSSSDSSTFTPVEQMPEFPGGIEALMRYLNKEVKYPQEAYRQGIEGAVYLTFIVEKDGSLSNIEVQKGILKECNEEAIRVVKNMPNWIPGKQSGIAVRVRFSLPIRFKAK